MAKINREEFLKSLDMVAPGLASRETSEQSGCFVFRKGRVLTYNEEVAVRAKSGLPKEIIGAFPAKPLLAILRKLPDDELDVSLDGTDLLLKGSGRRDRVHGEAEILLALDQVEEAGDWQPIAAGFSEAVAVVGECAGKNAEDEWLLSCVHVHPKWLEASDNFRACRYRVKTGLAEPCLVRRDALKHVVGLEMTEISATPSWLHFKNPAGLVLSCRRTMDAYFDLGKSLQSSGEPATLPKGLAEAADRADVFSSENGEDNLITIDLRPGRLTVRGEGTSGSHEERKKIAYAGTPIKFVISPKLLSEITKKYNECLISPGALKVAGERFTFVMVLGVPNDAADGGGEEEAAEEGGE